MRKQTEPVRKREKTINPTCQSQLTRMCGAVLNRARVATSVKTVKMRRHTRSSTMAANFQSLTMSDSSLLDLIVSVITLSSFSIKASSLDAEMMGVVGAVGLLSFPALEYFK